MNIEAVFADNQRQRDIGLTGKSPIPLEVSSLVVELEHYRRQSEWLSRVNDLHARLAGAVEMSAMIEAFSVWLMPLVDHDVVAYRNLERERLHMFCSCHGPERRKVEQVTDKIFQEWPEMDAQANVIDDQYYIYNWSMHDPKGSIQLVVLRKNKRFSGHELNLLEKGLQILREPLQRALEYEDLFEQASRDSLTGLANRRIFEERISSILNGAGRHGYSVSLACLDLDRFKQINDSFGHMVGDLVLQKVSRIMERMIRSCDLLVRMGGDEFMLIMSNTNLREAEILAGRICKAIEGMDLPPTGRGQLGVSIGLSEWNPVLTKQEWIQQADEALYKAKESGRSRVCTFSSPAVNPG